MTAPNVLEIKQIPCTLIANPTDPDAGTDSCGGTILGDSDEVFLVILQTFVPFKSSIYGRTYDEIQVEEEVYLSLSQKDFDPDMLVKVFPEVDVTATLSGKPLITGPLQASGRRLGSRTNRILLKPREVERHQGVLFYAGAAKLAERAELPFEVKKDYELPITIQMFPSDAGNTWKHGFLRDFGTADLS